MSSPLVASVVGAVSTVLKSVTVGVIDGMVVVGGIAATGEGESTTGGTVVPLSINGATVSMEAAGATTGTLVVSFMATGAIVAGALVMGDAVSTSWMDSLLQR